MDTRPSGLADLNPVRPRPFVGRRHYVDAATETLRSGATGAVLLVAEPGLGKSALAEAIAQNLAGEMIVMRVHGSPSLANVPYGVLAPYLVDLPEDPTSSHVAILRAFWAQFERLRAGRELPLLLLVDDAHELDSATANVIVDLITANWAKVVASCRPRPGLPASLMQLWYDSMAERFDLEPLGRDDVGDAAERILGGPVLPSTTHMLWTASEGNPMLLNCLLEDGRANGSMVRNNGVWLLAGPLATGGPALTGAVRNQLLRRTPQEREALTMIALAEPVSLAALEATSGGDMVQALVDSQLVEMSTDGAEQLRLRHAVYGQAIRSMVSSSRSLQLRQQLISYLDSQPGSEAALLRMVAWSVESGVKVPDHQLLKAAVHASRTFQNEAAINLAARIHDPGPWQQGRAAASRAYFNLGLYTEAARALEASKLEGLQGHGDSAAPAGCVLLEASIHSALAAAQPGGFGAALGRGPGHRAGVPRSVAGPPQPVMQLVDLDVAGDFQGLAGALEELGPMLLAGREDRKQDVHRAFLLCMHSDALRGQGDPVQALAEANQAAEQVAEDSGELFFIREFVLYRQAAAAVDAGDWAQAEKILGDYEARAGAGLTTFGGTVQYFRGMALVRQGRFDAAFKLLRAAVEALRLNDPLQLLRCAVGLTAYAAVRAGERQQAQILLDESRGFRGPGRGADWCLGPVFAAASGEVLNRDGAGVAALQDLLDSVSPALPAGARLQALSLWLELGSGAAVEQTLELTSTMTGQWASAWSHFASARGTRDPATAMKAAESVASLGMMRMARDGFAHAAGLFKAAGEQSGARQAAIRQAQCDHDLGEQKPGDVAGPAQTAQVQLTRRERDIIALAVEGLTDRQIADRLMVSVRTVEGHLYRSYAKLGIRRREELEGAAGL
ncbi:LuxR C-terminal-related transcriptional regulator [Arthrobacter sp. CJ23]|uniref:LuxR C-terminal-related transcriptional regulator n=1 Tax=Arthrobacter sp. CJ23 TaxID=2972479 RepID=UPI00215CC605|nr:LuxR family transcriptional regulator [Arthrobacter sp. CJ23]UVJ40727.1 LuxR C-terminal-related transcriptional regulator [Arthrobacter sp. CJ23]